MNKAGMNKAPAGILLAAGQSVRFGSNKLLHPLTGNKPMLLVSAQKLASVLPGSTVVINEALTAFNAQLEQMGLRVVVNERAQQGLGSSIARGVEVSQDASGWLIMLADMPYLKAHTIRLLADRLVHGANIVAPVYHEQRGHPVGFARCYKDELLSLNKDSGARQVIKNHQSQLERITVNDAGVIMDVDHASDLL